MLISVAKVGWINAWICIGLILLHQIANTVVLIKLNPQLLNKRGKLVQKNTKLFDKVFITFYIPISLIISIIAGLDAVRYEWSNMSFEIIIFGVGIFILACILGSWAMVVNPHFERTVLLNRDHKVCTSGPYKIVRHPGYTAEIIAAPSYRSFWVHGGGLYLSEHWLFYLSTAQHWKIIHCKRNCLDIRSIQKLHVIV